MQTLIRLGLTFAILLLAVVLIAGHGIRGLAVLMAIVLIGTATRSQAWKVSERWLVGVTGSRTRAGVLVFGVIIAILVAFNIYQIAVG